MANSPSGSATGNPRNKVALLPGHSLMDWIRLGNSGLDLTSVGGKILSVTEEELATHSSKDNAWLVIRGKVYNIAPYLNFHPGGADELMKGAGKDATDLFNEVHPWVNFESILQKCLVGRLVKSKPGTQDDLAKAFFNALAPPSGPSSTSQDTKKMAWTQTTKTITCRFPISPGSAQVLIKKEPDKHVRIFVKVRKKLTKFGFLPMEDIEWPCSVIVEPGKVEVMFTKSVEGCWKSLGDEDEQFDGNLDDYYRTEIVTLQQVTYNCRLIVVRFLDPVVMYIPVGHDVRIRDIVEGVETARRYTPTHLPSLKPPSSPSNSLTFLIKKYPQGALTPRIFERTLSYVLEVGGIGGDFQIQQLKDVRQLFLIAAGTGITPMTRLITWALSDNANMLTIKLLFMNRNEEDIIWKKELDALMKDNPKFSVQYGLSQPSVTWTGLRGRLDENILKMFLPFDSPPDDAYVCACGPQPFTLMIQEKLNAWGWTSRSHFFLG